MQMESGSAVFEDVACALCGADEAEVVYPARGNGDRRAREDFNRTYRASGDELLADPLVRCRRCDLQYVSPRPNAAVLLESYARGSDVAYVSQLEARERTFGRALSRIERLVSARGRLLDVGTAAGAFLAVARRRGWKVAGCEPNRWLAAWGARHYGLRIRVGDLADQAFKPASFDVVTLWDVIEHTPDPRRVVLRCAELLKPGGVLVINYPDIGSRIARLLGRRWPFLSSVHLYYFTRRTVRRLLEDAGLDVVAMRPHVQWLELEYVMQRVSVLSATASRVGRALVRWSGVSRVQIPYWLGQTFVAARRRVDLWLLTAGLDGLLDFIDCVCFV